jgi:hypothetical protein
MAKEIQLTKGKVAIVDDEDFEYLNQWKWHIKKSGNNYYAIKHVKKSVGTPTKKILLHRFLLNVYNSDLHIDHINNDSLDNRKINLRICTNSQNQMNRGKSCNNTSGYKGVTYHKRQNKFNAYITHNKKTVYLGSHLDPVDAAKAYNEAAIKFHGEFAKLNEI